MQSLLPNQRRSSQERSSLFLMILMGFLLVHLWMLPKNDPKQPNPNIPQNVLDRQLADEKKKNEPKIESGKDGEPGKIVEATAAQPGWVTLGSMDPKSPYKMLVTLTNKGAAIVRTEMNLPHFRDVQELSGYLGQIVVDPAESDKQGEGVTVQVLGPGTPAHAFGLAVGDRITRFDLKNKKTETFETTQIKKFNDLRECLLKTKPGDYIELTVLRKDRQIDGLGILLGQYPIDVIRPEAAPKDYEEYRRLGGLRGADAASDQLSFLTSLQKVDDHELDLPVSLNANNSKFTGMTPRDKTLDIELPGVSLRQEPWEIVSQTESEAIFRRAVPDWKLEMVKTYRLSEKVKPVDGKAPSVGIGYELTLKIEVRNLDTKEHKVAYQLDGPTGLPLEGGWYARKAGPGWGAYGIRDIVVRFHNNASQVIANTVIATDKIDKPWIDEPLDYIGVDSLYFQCTLKPKRQENEKSWHVRSFPIRVGEKNYDWTVLTDISYRLLSREKTLQPDEKIEHEYSVFLGPKDTAVLEEYQLGETISYGWFWFAAKPLLGVLHFFHSLGMTYAMAIIALTICVRLVIFPLSIKQAMGAIKMAAIQPELKEINEKYKDDMQARSAATSAVFKKHGYHPASGCLPLFIQLPIFIGLYKALQIDAGLYGTPLISSTVRWCSDLSAPDMLFDWSSFWTSIGWSGFNAGQGMLTLGPYFNLLPMLTIILFLVQQKVMMPPPTDEQSRMQQTMMKYMMIFMGVLFFKIPSGLCIYFIVSTTWGLLERRFIPKAKPVNASDSTYDVTPTNSTYDVTPAEAKERKKSAKDRNRGDKTPPKKEGFFGKLIREVTEKAAEQRKLEKTKKDKKKK